jgi:hypothetical protein
MKRMMMMVALAAFLVAALSVSALSAFAAPSQCPGSNPSCQSEVTGNEPTSPSNGRNAGDEKPLTETTTESSTGNSATHAGDNNPHYKETTVVTNRGSGTPGGQQPA